MQEICATCDVIPFNLSPTQGCTSFNVTTLIDNLIKDPHNLLFIATFNDIIMLFDKVLLLIALGLSSVYCQNELNVHLC